MARINVIVLSAGKSTRLQPISKGRPKPLVPIAGKAIIKHQLAWLGDYGINEVYINTHYRAQEVQSTLGKKAGNVAIKYLYEPNLLGTAGAVKNASKHWSKCDAILVIYGDNLMRFDLDAFYQSHTNNNALLTMALFNQNANPHTGIAGGKVLTSSRSQKLSFCTPEMASRGLTAGCTHKITGFTEGADPAVKPRDDLSSLVNAGAYFLKPEILEQIPNNTFYDFGHDVFPKLLEQNLTFNGFLIDGFCLGLDTPESFNRAEEMIKNNEISI